MSQDRFSLVNPTRSTHGRPSLSGVLEYEYLGPFVEGAFVYDAYGRSSERFGGRLQSVEEATYGSVMQRSVEWSPRFDAEALTDSEGQPYRFQSHRTDAESPLINFQLRDFNPSSKAWAQQEPLAYVDGPNAYLFCRGEPVNRVDPLGVEAV